VSAAADGLSVDVVDAVDPSSAPASDDAGESAQATPAGAATAHPTPNATANAPTRPTYLL
jgi:hypothetical protein